jgi:hypothetical protein
MILFSRFSKILNQIVETQLFTFCVPPMAFWHQAHSDKFLLLASYPRIDPCSTAGKQIGVYN